MFQTDRLNAVWLKWFARVQNLNKILRKSLRPCTKLILISKPGKSAAKAYLSHDVIRVSLLLPKPGLEADSDVCHFAATFSAQNKPFSSTQPDAGALASLSPALAKSKGKTRHFIIYLICGLFDTLENRVITSGLTLASISEAFWYPTRYEGALNPRKVEAA